MEKRDYAVYFQTGGNVNFKWQFTNDDYTKDEAIAKVNELIKMGYPAHYEKIQLIRNIGLPETFDNSLHTGDFDKCFLNYDGIKQVLAKKS